MVFNFFVLKVRENILNESLNALWTQRFNYFYRAQRLRRLTSEVLRIIQSDHRAQCSRGS